MGSPNWAKLVFQGRAKAHGVPWSEKEYAALEAIRSGRGFDSLRDAAEYVRRGALTVEDADALDDADAKYEATHGEKPLGALSRAELEEKIRVSTPQITTDTPTEVLRKLAEDADKIDEKKAARKKARKTVSKKKSA